MSKDLEFFTTSNDAIVAVVSAEPELTNLNDFALALVGGGQMGVCM